jgi:ssDNA-binding Zn-finger/Zn-ribbon topoisomerase 1
MKKLTTDIFVERARATHGEKYDYSKAEYTGANEKTTITCPEHGDFRQTPSHHLRGNGCPKCAQSQKRLDTNDFIQRAREAHGDKYDYSKVRYTGADTKVTITCPMHGDFSQRAADHLRGIGCRLCGNIEKSKKGNMGREAFVAKAIEKHGHHYDYALVNFVNTKTQVTIICPEHGKFRQTPDVHLRGCGCPVCRYIKSAKANALTVEQFKAKAKTVHRNRYDYSQVKYVNINTPVTIMCSDHGPFQQAPVSHLRRAGCPQCRIERLRKRWRKTKLAFIKEARKVHGDKYDYSRVQYETALDPVTIVCRSHGPFRQTPASHLQGTQCRLCQYSANADRSRMSQDDFIRRCEEKHHGKYSYELVDYRGVHEKVRIICPLHGEFTQLAGSHLAGRGCVYCQESGFRLDKPGMLYYARITDGSNIFWKIGITNRTVTERFSGPDLPKVKAIEIWEFDKGADALQLEQEILAEHSADLHRGDEKPLSTGNTELFVRDVLRLDTRSSA